MVWLLKDRGLWDRTVAHIMKSAIGYRPSPTLLDVSLQQTVCSMYTGLHSTL